MYSKKQSELIELLDGSVEFIDSEITILDEGKLRGSIEKLVKKAVLSEDELEKYVARYLVRLVAAAAGVYPNSIHDLYMARGSSDVPNNFTVPAINLRGLTFYAAKIIFNIANEVNAGAFIFEIARSEIRLY